MKSVQVIFLQSLSVTSHQKALSGSEGYRTYCSAIIKSYGVFFTGSSKMTDHGDENKGWGADLSERQKRCN